MSRSVDVNSIANQIVEAAPAKEKRRDTEARVAIRNHFERLTAGLAEYERQQVAWLVNFRLAAPVL